MDLYRLCFHPPHRNGADGDVQLASKLSGVELCNLFGVSPRQRRETVAAVIRITDGNFRLLSRTLTQVERILEINSLQQVTKAVVEAARARVW
jgi:hypothetical protein